jgi:flagellar basal body L-ring protein FlgH
MKRMLLIVIILALFTGCKNVEDLGAGNELALQNQTNLEKNVMIQLENFEKLATAAKWTEEDKKIFADQKAAIIEQLVINYAWLLVIKEAVEANDLDPKFFGQVLDRAPAWIEEGKKIYDLIKDMSKEE